jgi:primosomal replication protein N
MVSAPLLDNRLIIAGYVSGPCQTHYSPVGLPLTRFVLEHRSRQREADMAREARCRIQVIAGGEGLVRSTAKLMPGALVRVHGFISRANHRRGESRLVVHAEQIEILEISEQN